MSDFRIYPANILSMLNMEGYLDYFYSLVSGSKSNFEAWKETEAVYLKYFNRHKFSTYSSFKACRSRYYRKRRTLLTQKVISKC